MTTGFGTAFKVALSAAGLSQNAFAKQVKTSSSFVSEVLTGKRTPPLDRLKEWLAVLNITTDHSDYQYMLDLAATAHLPQQVQSRFEYLLEHVASMEERLAAESKGADYNPERRPEHKTEHTTEHPPKANELPES